MERKKISKIYGVILKIVKLKICFQKENRYFFHNAASIFKNLHQKIPFDEELSGKEDRFWIKKN